MSVSRIEGASTLSLSEGQDALALRRVTYVELHLATSLLNRLS